MRPYLYAKPFKLHQDGKSENTRALTQVSDRGVQTQPTQRQREV
ncbi:MAG TPA: addiction module toxin RelE [Leclercia adecarboxylata]|nr:addiction module toxin RelE [Leclercia adecarboxylata]HCQ09513.1 addiction module toxin RelE [Leclercia adecarboxylata]